MAQQGPLPRISQGWNQGTIWAMFSSEGLTGEAFASTSSGSLVELISCDCRTEAQLSARYCLEDTLRSEKLPQVSRSCPRFLVTSTPRHGCLFYQVSEEILSVIC